MTNDSCIFCSIVNKKIKANIISETDKVMAFEDINPAANVHILIIPKTHISNLNEINENHASIMASMMLLAKDLASQLGVNKTGYRLVINTEKQAGQTVFHLHCHLLGGRDLSWPPG